MESEGSLPSFEPWTYEAETYEDLHGSDTFHHVVCGERYIAEVATKEDAELIVAAVNRYLATGVWS